MTATPTAGGWVRWTDPSAPTPMLLGCDYNPEQWDPETWADDVVAMRGAGVNVVSLGVFAWARLQPTADTWDFGWLDTVMDLLDEHGIGVDLATATASPPPWLTTRHPEILPVTFEGHTVWPGARQHWRPTSPVFREHALRLVRAMADRYGTHPALVAWHVSNELGCHNVHDYSDDAARAFRVWLRLRYGGLQELNRAWGGGFWSQHYTAWEQVLPPRFAGHGSFLNPTQRLDFQRFSSDALADHLRAERDLLRELTPDVPVTTNFMVMGGQRSMDYASWARDVDFVANDHYTGDGDDRLDELSFSANLTSGIAGGAPWFLMEHSTSAVNWKGVNRAKGEGEMLRDSLLHVAHGADAVCFFQWRQSAAGAEKYHSAMVPHAGTDTAVHAEVRGLGRRLAQLAPVVGSRRARADVAVLFDWASWWAAESLGSPSQLLRYRREGLDWYRSCLDLGLRADVLPAGHDLDGYALVLAPMLHVVPDDLRDRLTRYAEDGGHLVTTYYSGIVDEHDRVRLGGYPGALRDLLGLRIEEFGPLGADETVTLDDGSSATVWTDRVDVRSPDVEVPLRYKDGVQAGRAAVTRRPLAGGGSAAYVSTRLADDSRRRLLDAFATAAGVRPDLGADLVGKVEVVVREDDRSTFRFLVNRTDGYVEVPVPARAAVVGATATPEAGADHVVLAPRAVVVTREARDG